MCRTSCTICSFPIRWFTPTRPLPDLAYVHKELRRKHVTLQLLWDEYRTEHPDGYSYTQFASTTSAGRRPWR